MFDLEKKLQFYHERDFMAIDFKWFSPMAYFYLFFTIVWNAFLVFWYTMVFAGGAPWLFLVVPIIHVAVGLFLAYYTACQFFNRTNIEVDPEYLTIRHLPIPWWRGNVEIPTHHINQLYVKEVRNQGKNGTTYSYSLRAKLTDNTDKEILAITGVEDAQMKEIESQLERFIGITDRPVKGEYAPGRKDAAVVQPRRQRRDFTDSPLLRYYFQQQGNRYDLRGEEVKVISITQYDWNDGNSDKLFQLITENEKERLVYFDQNKAILNAFEEQVLNLATVGAIHFQPDDPPKSIEVAGTRYELSHFKTGTYFVVGGAQNVKVEQWIYQSSDKQTSLRVTDANGIVSYHQATKLEQTDFEDTMDLNDLPERKIEYNQRDWEEEDLV